jgi:hypothetical protein
MGFPLYFGLPSVIFPVALFALQIQQSTIVEQVNLQFIKIGNYGKKEINSKKRIYYNAQM